MNECIVLTASYHHGGIRAVADEEVDVVQLHPLQRLQEALGKVLLAEPLDVRVIRGTPSGTAPEFRGDHLWARRVSARVSSAIAAFFVWRTYPRAEMAAQGKALWGSGKRNEAA